MLTYEKELLYAFASYIKTLLGIPKYSLFTKSADSSSSW